MGGTEVRTSELDDKAREFKFHVDVDAPFDGQIFYLDLDADWAYEIVDANARLNAGELNLTIKIDAVSEPGYDPWNILVGSLREQAPTATGPASIPKGGQLIAEIEVTTGMTIPEKFKFELRCRIDQDNA